MDNFGMIIILLSMLGLVVFFIMSIVSLIKKNGKAKKNFLITGGCFGLMIVGSVLLSAGTPTPEELAQQEKIAQEQQAKEEAAKAEAEKIAKGKAEAEAKAKAEQEAKAKAEAEKKAKAEAKAKAKELAKKKANAKSIEYAQLKKNPDRHAGEYVKYRGQVIQIQEGDNITNIRLSVTKESYGWNPNDIIFVEYPGYTDYVEEDIITVYGTIYGEYSYTSQAGWKVSVPGLLADSFE